MSEPWNRLLTRWTGAGLIDAAAADRIRAFEQQHAGATRLQWPIWLALGFGALMLGAAALLFVSAHWDELSPFVRFTLVLAMVSVFHVAGAAVTPRFPGMATALHFVGTVSLGAGIFLGGQIFNLDSHWPSGVLLWAIGAGAGWLLLEDVAQLALVAILVPAWLVSEWTVATTGYFFGSDFRVTACGCFLLAVAYFSAVTRHQDTPRRRVLLWIGGLSVLPAALAVANMPNSMSEAWLRSNGIAPPSATLLALGWVMAFGLPLVASFLLRRVDSWPNVLAAGWTMALVGLRAGELDLARYAWWALGAGALVAWGVRDGRRERINMGAAILAATVLAFYLSEIMSKLSRSASLLGLGIVFLAGGWGLERARRHFVRQAQSGSEGGGT